MGRIDDIFSGYPTGMAEALIASCSRCYRTLGKTGPLCEACSAWDYSGNLKYTQSQVDDALASDRAVNSTQAKYIEELREEVEKWKRSEEVYRTNADVFVAAERERCAQIAEGIIDKDNPAQYPNWDGGWESAAEEIATKIREGK